jgi:hypothetical protein
MVGAKGLSRELSEEEKQAVAAAIPQKGKAPPVKGKVEEKLPNPEELAAVERERQAKEEE